MDAMVRGVVTLIKSAVTEQKMELPEGFSMEQAYPVLKKHSILTLACDGALRCGIPPQSPALQRMLRGYMQLTAGSERQMTALERLYSAFDAHGIDYLPLKGCEMKLLYPKPELRSMGDADILIRMDQYAAIRQIMEAQGYALEAEYNHTINFRGADLYLELHKRVVPTSEPDLYAYFGDGWQKARPKHGTYYAMSPEDAYLYLFGHFAKHYRHGGIGCRHMTDLFVYRRSHPEMDEAYLLAELKKLRLLEFHRNISNTLEVWFGDRLPDEKTEWITNVIFESGNWGKLESQAAAEGFKVRAESGSEEDIKYLTMLNIIFPPAALLAHQYHFLENAPVLLPAAWVMRWFAVLRKRRRNIKRRFRKIQMITEEKVDSFAQSLRFVGLEYHTDDELHD